MDTVTIAIIAILVVVIVGTVFFLYRQKARSKALRSKFGPEYTRVVEHTHDRAKAEAELARREKRVAQFHIRPLSVEDENLYLASWRKIQALFVDNPQEACSRAEQLLNEVLVKRGYPLRDFEQQAADLSVEHPVVVQHYHAAHQIALRHREGKTQTEDLRQAMIHYRALFDDLLAETAPHAKAS
jgi:hypothetical protein